MYKWGYLPETEAKKMQKDKIVDRVRNYGL